MHARFGKHRVLTASCLIATVVALLVGLGLNGGGKPTASSKSRTLTDPEMADMAMPDLASYRLDAPALVPEGWTATATSSAPGHGPSNVLNGETPAYWQSTPRASLPQSITIDMQTIQEVSTLSYAPRQSSKVVGAIGRFSVRVSTDGKHFGAPIATGTWQNTTATKTIGFAPVGAKYIKLTALSYAAGSGKAITASDITLYGAPQEEAPQDAANGKNVSSNPGVSGEWGSTIGFPLVPVAAALLPDNQLLTWSSDADETFAVANTVNYTQTAILNLNTGQVTQVEVTNTQDNMFCPGVAILPNGDIIVAGGDTDQATSIYNPTTDAWTKATPMNIPRGYNGMTLLSDGQAFTLGGSWSGGVGGKSAEVWSQSAGWRELPGVPENLIETNDDNATLKDSYGWFISTSDNDVLVGGPASNMDWVTTSGSGSITKIGKRSNAPVEMEGNAVYFNTDEVLALGGAKDFTGANATDDPSTNKAYVINFSTGTPVVTETGSMQYARTYSNSVVLPNGEVLVLGGQTYAYSFHDTESVLNPELWNPQTGQFTVMAAEAEPRNYHSVAVLLPNGEVFSGGGGLCGKGCGANHPDGQIFSPPYLFNSDGTPATRPVIEQAPTSATDGDTISVTTDSPISSFSLVRYGESTHAADDDQRLIPLSIVSQSGDTYELSIPSDPGVVLPGPYMLFAMNSQGTPSIASTVMISDVTSGPTDPYGESVMTNAPAIYWPLDDSSGSVASDVSGNQDTGNYSSTGVSYGVPSPVEGSNGEGVSLDGQSGQVESSQEWTDNSQQYSESVWFNTTTSSGGYLASLVNASDSKFDDQLLMTPSGQLEIGSSGTGGYQNISSTSYNDGNWHNAVVVGNTKKIQLYVDGQLVAEASSTKAAGFLARWMLGDGGPSKGQANAPSDFFQGTVSDASYYDYPLNSTEIQAQFSASGAG